MVLSSSVCSLTWFVPEADLWVFSMFGRTGTPTKRGPLHPENIGVFVTFSGLRGPLCGVLQHLKVSGAARHSLAYIS